ncbi:MAG TPA: extracellular solute-binding protein [Chloroflexota bacterium]
MPSAIRRRDALKLLGLGLLGAALAACGQPSAASSSAGSSSGAPPALTSWDELVAAAKREGKVVVNGSPDPKARPAITDGFRKAYGIELEYLGGNSSQLAARVQNERAADQYLVDAGVGGSDTVYGSFLPNGWLDPLKPALIMPEVVDGSRWKRGEPWFRDPKGEMVLQIFQTITPNLTLNTQFAAVQDFPNADALLDPKWKGKICAYDPSVNGAGIGVAAALYVAKGKDYVSKLYKGQNVALSRDYQQVADWVAHGAYPIGLAVPRSYLEEYIKSGGGIAQPALPDAPDAVGAGFGLVFLWNRAPHPYAARLFANWIASHDGMLAYAQSNTQVPLRTDIDPTWLPPQVIPKPGVKYLDTYDYEFETSQRLPIRDFYASLLK